MRLACLKSIAPGKFVVRMELSLIFDLDLTSEVLASSIIFINLSREI